MNTEQSDLLRQHGSPAPSLENRDNTQIKIIINTLKTEL